MRVVLIVGALYAALLPLTGVAVAPEADCQRLVEWMSGSFSSEQQAAANPDYYDIRLEMARIWPDRARSVQE